LPERARSPIRNIGGLVLRGVGIIEQMSNPVWYWLLPIAITTPWLAGIAWIWARLPKDGFVPQSAGERARARLESR
jgi:hypothetical protein